MAVRVVIPARLQSTRLPNKVLADIAGKPMIQHVYDRAMESQADSVVIATEHEDVQRVAEAFGATVCMTRDDHFSGTSRIAEVVEVHGYADDDVVINVQGDEPLLPAELVNQVAALLVATPEASVATLFEPMDQVSDVLGAHDVKVITDKHNFALYFSRAPIPFHLKGFVHKTPELPASFIYQRHIGLYAYHASFLKTYVEMEPSPLEALESLEQLRVLWHGKKIILAKALAASGIAVDTLEDLEKARVLFQ